MNGEIYWFKSKKNFNEILKSNIGDVERITLKALDDNDPPSNSVIYGIKNVVLFDDCMDVTHNYNQPNGKIYRTLVRYDEISSVDYKCSEGN